MLQGMDQSEFGTFVAAIWERHGWRAQVKRDDGRAFVAVERPATDDEGLIWAIPGGGEVGGQQVQQFRSLCDDYDVEEAAVVTAGALSDHAEKVAEGTDVELLDGEGVADLLERRGMTDLLAQYGGESGGSGGGSSGGAGGSGAGDGADDDGSPLDRVTAVAGRVSRGVGDALPVSGTVAVVVVVALVAAGVLFGPSIPFLGGGDPVSAASATPDDSVATLRVSWNAKVVDEIDPNRTDGLAYYPPEGERFVVVRMSVNNTGPSEAALKQAAFDFRTDEATYGHQAFADHDGFVDFNISPGTYYAGWTAFSVPEGTTGTLVYDQNATDAAVAVEFERDRELAVNVTRL